MDAIKLLCFKFIGDHSSLGVMPFSKYTFKFNYFSDF